MAKLVVKSGKNEGTTVDLADKPVILGRADTVDLQIHDNKASREHCRIFQQGDAWVVADLNSRNGILVNGVKTTRRNLRDGDRISIGQTTVVFEGAGSAKRSPTDEVPQNAPAKAKSAPAAKAPPAAPARKGASARDKAFAAARADPGAARAAARAAPAGKAKSAPAEEGLQVSDRVLQYSKTKATSNMMQFDVEQMSAGMKALLTLAALAIFAACLWGVIQLMG